MRHNAHVRDLLIALTPWADPSAATPLLEKWLWGIQIGFFTLTAIVAIVTYLSAKRTVFQPIRTEVFKIQLVDVQEVLDYFAGKSGFTLSENLGWDAVFEGNCNLMYVTYAQVFLRLKIDESKAAHTTLIPLKRGILRDDELQLVEDHIKDPSDDTEGQSTDMSAGGPRWETYEHRLYFGVSQKYEDEIRKIRLLRARPLLPTELVSLIDEYRAFIDGYLTNFIDVLTVASQDMPTKYPTFDELKLGVYNWIRARFTPPESGLEIRASAIVDFVRAYYQPDRLMPSNRPS